MNKIKKVKVINRTTIELVEDAYKGDQIDLNEINQIDTSILEEEINKQVEQKLNKERQNIVNNTINEQVIKFTKEREEFNQKIENLKNELVATNANKDIEKRDALDQLKKLYDDQINKLQVNLNTIDQAKNVEKEKELLNQKRILDDKILELKDQIAKLNNDNLLRSKFSSKLFGEQLEQELKNNFERVSSSGAFAHCKFYKDNISIENDSSKASKADFIFEIYDKSNEYLLTKICIEAKNLNPDAIGAHKHNKDHLPKLAKDAIKKECEYALLVTELEPENTFIFKKANELEYPNIYMCRPEYFIDVLGIFYNFTIAINNEKAELIQKENDFLSKNEQFAKRIEIENRINELKEGLETTINLINQDSDKVANYAQKIITQAEEIKKIMDERIRSKFTTFTNKINKFNLKNKDLEQFEDNSILYTQNHNTTHVAYMKEKKHRNNKS